MNSQKTNEDTIERVLAMILKSYPGRFEILPGMAKVWLRLLRDLLEESVYAAVTDLCATLKYPPSIAEVRSGALDIVAGGLCQLSEWEAWERVLRLSQGEQISLSDDERRALALIGGTWSVKNSQSLSYDRHAFCEAYKEFTQKRRRIDGMVPEVLALAEQYSPPLPQLPVAVRTDESVEISPVAPEQVDKLLDQVLGYRDQFPKTGETKYLRKLEEK